ncbi:MAG: pyruvate, phosphate dikinase [Verrucomicrobia bacterium]|nr:pyruvate, phosphate dikinase [Verrucomicrobiota bacterium]
MSTQLTTGLPGLDRTLKGVITGDNIVWRVDSIDDYRVFATPYAQAALRSGRPLVYFRFAPHPPLLDQNAGAEIVELNPRDGFESFLGTIHLVIERTGRGAYYLFDSLSGLAVDWYSDSMLGSFFMLTCPYLFDMETIAYFALARNQHSPDAIDPISSTTQILLDVYRRQEDLYLHPIKVQHRYSPTMNMLHHYRDGEFKPVTSSAVTAEILVSQPDVPLPVLGTPREQFNRNLRMTVSRDPQMLTLLEQYLDCDELSNIRQRLIGTGLIGGKAVGMILARAILKTHQPHFRTLLEQHDSFYVGSDVFYSFLVRNGIWWLRQKQRNPETFLEGSEEARRRILTGAFPDSIVRQFERMLDYFGQSPFIVRSSSLLEDNYGNSFAGKYDSIFCVNQGPRERRLENFLAAVRSIYASAMSERALRYRARRGLLDKDEQMSLLVMRVSGCMSGRYFYPHVAGVGFSFNPYAWSETIDPRAGVMRIVFGLGTRAVDRTDDDYTRLVALNAPERRPESSFDEVCQYAQHRMDYLDLEANQLVSGYFTDVTRDDRELPVEMFATEDRSEGGGGASHWVLTFDRLLKQTDFVKDCRAMLETLEQVYHNPVDIEFTANFLDDEQYKINLLQCRPLQVKGLETIRLPEFNIPDADRIIEARGAVIGQSRLISLDRLVYVVPETYARLPMRDRYEVARLIGRINFLGSTTGAQHLALIGPGRWGTRSPELGVPVNYAEINRVNVLCEMVMMHEHLIPDASLGTHFLNELVEMDMLYLALFPQRERNFLNHDFFLCAPNRLRSLIEGIESRWEDVIRVFNAADVAGQNRKIALSADAREQKVLCFLCDNSVLTSL